MILYIMTGLNVLLFLATTWQAAKADLNQTLTERDKGDCQRYYNWLQADISNWRNQNKR